jgi:catechol 2,3-dioxygenase-like lactoylglutathione lyase family enzyme
MRLHHIGVVVSSIETHARQYAEQLRFTRATDIIEDPIQRVRVQFWAAPDGALIELIEPTGPDSPANRSLAKGGGLNHLAFEVSDVAASVREAVAAGAACTCEPVPAAAYGGRPIGFVFYRHIGLVEFVERRVHGR